MKPLAVALAALFAIAPRLAAEGFDAAAVYEEGVKSVAFLSVLEKGKAKAIGSGSLIDAEKRYVLTSAHVVGNLNEVLAQFAVRGKDGRVLSDKRKYLERVEMGRAWKGKVLFRDKARDLALVQLDDMYADTPAIPLAKESARAGTRSSRSLAPPRWTVCFGRSPRRCDKSGLWTWHSAMGTRRTDSRRRWCRP
jgi:S1-C subfamily serine protease